MIIIACVAIVCATALAGLAMHLRAQKPVARAEFDLVKGDLTVLEKKFVEFGTKVLSVEKKVNLHSEPAPVVKRPSAGGGPLTREERLASQKA